MFLLKRLTFSDVINAVAVGEYRAAGSISVNLVRNKLNASNSIRRSKWWAR
jgi:hypothetical protein